MACQWLINNPGIVSGSEVAIYSDSQIVIKDLSRVLNSNRYKPAKAFQSNLEDQEYNNLLTETLASLVMASFQCCKGLTLRWVQAHKGHKGNEMADGLAKTAANGDGFCIITESLAHKGVEGISPYLEIFKAMFQALNMQQPNQGNSNLLNSKFSNLST